MSGGAPRERRRPEPGSAYDALVVGGGFYGAAVAVHLRRRFPRVALIEQAPDLMLRASYANQARVHNGYHYPRSVLTAVRSRANFPRFAADYADCVQHAFDSYYAIVRRYSNVSSAQFATFCRRIGASIAPAPAAVRRLFDPQLVEQVYRVVEYVFDADALRNRMRADLDAAGVELLLGTECTEVASSGDELLASCTRDGRETELRASYVFNCCYARLNRLCSAPGGVLPLRHELTELALVEVPQELQAVGVTVMCGPFFSLLPFPPRGLHSFSHVRYTPHFSWQDDATTPWRDPDEVIARAMRSSRYPHMVRDARRFLPVIDGCRYRDSLWEVKTVLPSSEVDDSRPILFKSHAPTHRFVSILGGKIDNIYDVEDELDSYLSPAVRDARGVRR